MVGTTVADVAPGVEILEDLRSAIAGAACLINANAAADDLACACNLLMQARERARTLAEVLHATR